MKIHNLRYTGASLLHLVGTNMKIVSERFCHTDLKLTMNRYSYVLEEIYKKTSNNLSKILFR
ncbi:TPA: integrase [Clostridioides difficile]|uniref:integrase n=1 Tax=Clostridioides difficile TaxID=1496 RepID=UPI000D1EE6A6|nr:integrase [Clostridioides difficile]EGT2203945.1 integrase [Clostridioides difficile]EGT4667123.1 integrase [Clostridioides difficile]UWD42445.1 integrase [Clostridioides difficile]UWD46082.1 integrase [Clostridioides difficile]HBE9436237.1 integrase [Clostridioides difficile]